MNNIKRVRCQECGRLLVEVLEDAKLIIKCYKCSQKYIVLVKNDKVEMKKINE